MRKSVQQESGSVRVAEPQQHVKSNMFDIEYVAAGMYTSCIAYKFSANLRLTFRGLGPRG